MGLCSSKPKYITYFELDQTPPEYINDNKMNNYVIYNEENSSSVYYSCNLPAT